jgi:catechol 2,3-dioxygenase
MEIKSLGHVVVRVADRERSKTFYRDVLGLPVCAHYDKDGMKMAFFTLGNHHDFAIMQTTVDAPTAEGGIGLDHVAFNIGTTMDELREAKACMDAAGVATNPVDHNVTKSLYLQDPDGNGIELYVDASDAWREDPQCIATGGPLDMTEA